MRRAVRLRDRWVSVGALCAVVAFATHLVKVLTNRSGFDIIAIVALLGTAGSVGAAAAINRRTHT